MRQSSFEGPAAKMAETLNEFTAENWLRPPAELSAENIGRADQEEFRKAVAVIREAHRVFIHAKSASASLGQLLMFRLRRLALRRSFFPPEAQRY